MEPIEENPWPRPDSDVQKTNVSSPGSSGQDMNNAVPNTVIEKHVQKRIFKIIVIGDSNVGKTCLTFRFCGGSFPEKTEATIGVDFREKTLEVEGEIIKVGHGYYFIKIKCKRLVTFLTFTLLFLNMFF